MNVSTSLERTLTELDHVRLSRLLDVRSDPTPDGDETLGAVLRNAMLVPSRKVAPDIVTMYSQVALRDLASGRRHTLTVCYPPDAEPAAGFVSVLSPVGAALLGLRVGMIARWRTPNGDEGAAEVTAIHFQPEASGDYTL